MSNPRNRIAWNPPGTRPEEVGVYRRRVDQWRRDYVYWDGKLWYGVVARTKREKPLGIQAVEWAPTVAPFLTDYQRGRRAGLLEAVNMTPDELMEICGGFE
jgi:hypothetical protein